MLTVSPQACLPVSSNLARRRRASGCGCLKQHWLRRPRGFRKSLAPHAHCRPARACCVIGWKLSVGGGAWVNCPGML